MSGAPWHSWPVRGHLRWQTPSPQFSLFCLWRSEDHAPYVMLNLQPLPLSFTRNKDLASHFVGRKSGGQVRPSPSSHRTFHPHPDGISFSSTCVSLVCLMSPSPLTLEPVRPFPPQDFDFDISLFSFLLDFSFALII